MCLYVRSGPHRARKTIKVFKVLRADGRSPVRNMKYTPGNTYSSDFGISVVGTRLTVGKGLHSCVTRKEAIKNYGNDVKEMIIPKGAVYFIGFYGTIVSNILFYPKEKQS